MPSPAFTCLGNRSTAISFVGICADVFWVKEEIGMWWPDSAAEDGGYYTIHSRSFAWSRFIWATFSGVSPERYSTCNEIWPR
jgi:hypothetical protein